MVVGKEFKEDILISYDRDMIKEVDGHPNLLILMASDGYGTLDF